MLILLNCLWVDIGFEIISVEEVVCKIKPPDPTIHPFFASVNVTSFKVLVIPLGCIIQSVPPLVVLTIVPLFPTAIPLFGSAKLTESNILSVALD